MAGEGALASLSGDSGPHRVPPLLLFVSKTPVLSILIVLAALALGSACGGGQTSRLGEIRTSDGKYRITKADRGNRYPPGCSGDCFIAPPGSSSSSQTLKPGYQVVALRIEPLFKETSNPVLDELCLQSGAVYIKAEDGSKADCSGVGFTSEEKVSS
jgi:hypothetical protein